MLVLTVKVNGRINLSQECNGGFEALGTILIRKVKGQAVSIGLELRKDVRIIRAELDERPAEEAVTK